MENIQLNVAVNRSNDEVQIDFDDFVFTEDHLRQFDAIAESVSNEDSENDEIFLPKKRRRVIFDSGSDSDAASVENLVTNLRENSNTHAQKWSAPDERSVISVVPFTQLSGMNFPYKDVYSDGKPEQFYSLLVSDDLFEIIANQTNLFATQTIMERDHKPSSRSHNWTPTHKEEIKKVFGLILFMGLVKLPHLSDYWSKDKIMRQTFPSKVMSRNRFEIILQYLHFCDNQNTDGNDRIGKIRDLIDELNNNFKTYYSPKEDICVDESMIPFRGRLIFRQYNKQKRHKYGIKLFKLCTNPGYTYKFQVYCGKNFDTVNTTPTKVVLSLCEDLLNKGHTLATDNWYTSLDLAYELLNNGTHLIGTVRKNRRGLPEKVVTKNLKRGEFVAQQNINGITVLKWKDKRDVLMLSTKHTDKFRNVKVKGKVTSKPAMVLDYNKSKAAVDMNDQMSSYSSPLRKSVKWYKKLAIELLLNTAVVNARIMYMEATQNQISMVEYRKNLVEFLTSEQHITQAEESTPKRLKHELKTKPGLVRNTRRFCVQCYKDNVRNFSRKDAKNKTKKVNTYCFQCDGIPYYCLPCFNKVHRYQ